MGRIETIGPVDLRLWLVMDGDNQPLQVFKGSEVDAVKSGQMAYPDRKDIRAVEAVKLWSVDGGRDRLQFAALLAFVEWVVTQFSLIQQMSQARVMPAAGMPPTPHRH